MHFNTVVIGAGINGLCTAYHLLRRGCTNLAVIEQHALGHSLGSSHGQSRITRSSYNQAKYVQLIQIAHEEEWPRLAKEAGRSFLHPTSGCFFGPGNKAYIESLAAVPEVAAQMEILSAPQARRVFPSFTFTDSDDVIKDPTCAVIAAAETMTWLAQAVGKQAPILEHLPVVSLTRQASHLTLTTGQSPITCERLAITAGAWLPQLLPELSPKLQVAHQDVGYFALQGIAQMPVWIYSPKNGDSFYGLPEFRRPGIKIARHRTGAEGGKPDRTISPTMPQNVQQELENFFQLQFTFPAKVIGYEACLYTNTVKEDFILDHHPQDPRIVIGSACSGHGFKFGPLSGRILAQLLLDGKTDIKAFEDHRQDFALSSQKDWH